MKKTIAAVLVLLLVVGAYLTFNIESIFAKSSPVFVGEGVSNVKILENIESLDIKNDSRDDLIKLFGAPESYIWGDKTFSVDELIGNYIMSYSDNFDIWMSNDLIIELRFYSDFYKSAQNISVGMSKDDVVALLEAPSEIKKGVKNQFKEYVFYEDIDNEVGYCYYASPKDNIRLFFKDYKVLAMYITGNELEQFDESKYGKQKESTTTLKRVNVDDIDLPFVNDEEVIGAWNSVDFVDEISEFKPSETYWEGDLYLEELVFKAEGKLSVRYLKWTKGIVMHSGDTTASAYTIKEIDGTTYMFFEWKSGDYIFRDMKPSYYVLKKEN